MVILSFASTQKVIELLKSQQVNNNNFRCFVAIQRNNERSIAVRFFCIEQQRDLKGAVPLNCTPGNAGAIIIIVIIIVIITVLIIVAPWKPVNDHMVGLDPHAQATRLIKQTKGNYTGPPVMEKEGLITEVTLLQ